MKCIRDKNNGIVTRIGNLEAINLVKGGECEFVSKNVWRENTRDAHRPKPKVPVKATVVESAGEMVGGEIAIADKPRYKKGVSGKKSKSK